MDLNNSLHSRSPASLMPNQEYYWPCFSLILLTNSYLPRAASCNFNFSLSKLKNLYSVLWPSWSLLYCLWIILFIWQIFTLYLLFACQHEGFWGRRGATDWALALPEVTFCDYRHKARIIERENHVKIIRAFK